LNPWIKFFGLFVLLGATATAWLAESILDADLQQQSLSDQRQAVIGAFAIRSELADGLNQLARIRNDPRVAAGVRGQTESLQELFQTLMLIDENIHQARWIDAEGLERVRLQREADQVFRIEDKFLQNKSGRDYFQSTQTLTGDYIWVSPIDLNVEQGQVEYPLRPTVRFVTPIPGELDQGILILNYDARPILANVLAKVDESQRLGFFSSPNQWVLGPNGAQAWANQLGVPIDAEGPLAAYRSEMQNDSTGSLAGTFGQVTWAKVTLANLELPVIAPDLVVVKHWPRAMVSAAARDLYIVAWPAWALLMLLMGYVSFQWFKAQQTAQAALSEQLNAEKAASEAAAYQATLLERSNKDLDEFAFAAAHDLRSPLRSISQYAEILSEEAKSLDNEHRGYLDRIQVLSQNLDRMLKGLLQYSRIGRSDSKPTRVNTREVAVAAWATYQTGDFSVSIGELPDVYAPEPLVELMFRNLLMNAIKHHHRISGHIAIVGQRIGDSVELKIADDGPGIPEQDWERVFKMFSSLKSGRGGDAHGLGLALLKRAAAGAGGEIFIGDSSDLGTTFVLRLPAAV
jgi:signal transduction histidine kinase